MFKNPAFWSVVFFLVALAQALGDWHSRLAAQVCTVCALALLLYAFVSWLRLPEGFRWTADAFRSLGVGGNVSLPVAARIAYEEARAHNTIWAHAAERLAVDKTPEGILDYMAGYFAGEVQVYGRRTPSTRLEQIDKLQAESGAFRGGARYLYLRDNGRTEFTDLQMSRKDLWAVRKRMREAMNADTQI
jgi:hypothetical protein